MAEIDIKSNLKAIVTARSQKADAQRAKAQALAKEWEANRVKLELIYSKFSSLRPDEQEKLCGDKAAALLRNVQAKTEACNASVQKAIDELENLAKRFDRSTVNLVIVGAMGAGKSKFLQSASGLSDDCIPAYTGGSCTGVTSIIENSSKGTEALLIFKSRQEALEDMRQEIQNFARRLHAETEISEKMSDFADGVQNLRKLQKVADRDGQRIIGAEDGVDRTVEELDKRSLRDLLALYDQHLDVWERYLDNPKAADSALDEQEIDGVKQYVLKERQKIEEYVSKHGKEDHQRYYKYAAIKQAVIRTRLSDQINAQIRLIDTVGIGDPAVDTETRIADAVRNDADGVIFLLSMGANRPTLLVQQDRALIEKFQDIYQSYSNKEVDEEGRPVKEKRTKYWMAFLVNDRPTDGMTTDDVRKYLTQTIIPSFSTKNKIFGEEGIVFKNVVNVAKSEQVEQVLAGFLQQISDHLEEIDAGVETAAKHACTMAETQMQTLLEKLRALHINYSGNPKRIYITDITINRLSCLKKELGKYAGSILADKASGSKKASFLQQCMDNVRCLTDGGTLTDFSFCGGSEGVSLEGIVDYYNDYYNSKAVKDFFPQARLAVFDALQGVIREMASHPLAQQTDEEKNFKQKIAKELISCLKIDCRKLGDDPAEALDAGDSRFFQKVCETLTVGIPYMEEIKEAFLSVDQFKLDHSNGIAKALFCCLAAEHLCDTPYDMQEFPPDGDTDKDRLLQELKQKLEAFIDAVRQRTMSEIYLVDENDQKYHELVNFIRIFDPINEGKWQNIFANLDEQNLLLHDTECRERLATAAAIAEDLDALLRTI